MVIHCRIAEVSSNSFILFGVHACSLQPAHLSIQWKENGLAVKDITHAFAPIHSSCYAPKQSLQEPIQEPVDTVFAGYSVHSVSGRVFLIGGGGVFYWMPHFNHSLWCVLPIPSQAVEDKKRSLPRSEKPIKLVKMEEKPQWVLRVTDKKLVRINQINQRIVEEC